MQRTGVLLLQRKCVFGFLLISAVLMAAGAAPGQTPAKRSLISEAVNENKLTLLRGNTHPMARPEFDRGAAPPDLMMRRILLVLKRTPEQEAALATLLDQQQDKSSPNFHRWLTPQEFGRQFGPTDEDIAAVTGWLQLHGFQVTGATRGRVFIEFSGTAANVQEAFHTTIHKFVVDGDDHWANVGDPSIPSALTPIVAGPFSLHGFRKHTNLAAEFQRASIVRSSTGDVNLTNNQGQVIHAVAPADLAAIYNIPNFLTGGNRNGEGGTVGVIGRSNINMGDIETFRAVFDLGGSINIVLNGPDPGNLGGAEELEAVLDASWAGAAAPNAQIDLVISQSTETSDGVDLSEVFLIDNDLDAVITESFGRCEQEAGATYANAAASLAAQAAAQGMTFVASSGDSGAVCSHQSTETIATQIPASLPYVTAVGGTMFITDDAAFWNPTNDPATKDSAKGYIPEVVWNESINGRQGATGGGISTFFAAPLWQKGVTGLSGGMNRQVPDVSLHAAAGHDAFVLCIQDFNASCAPGGSVLLVGGTSASSPSFAGIMALVVQSQANRRQGEAGYVLYKLAAVEQNSPTFAQCNASAMPSGPISSACVFNDVTVGNNVFTGEAGSTTDFQAASGYDLATGLGSVNVNNLINSWGNVRTIETATSLTSPTVFPITHGDSASFTVNVSPQSGSTMPSGNVSLLAPTGLRGEQSVASVVIQANGSATVTTNTLPGGQYGMTAHYEGDSTFSPSESPNSVNVTVLPEASSTHIQVVLLDLITHQITNDVTSAPYGANDAIRVDVSSVTRQGCSANFFSISCPSGTIAINSNGQPLDAGTFRLNSLGYVEDQAANASLTPGTYQLSSNYSGDASYSSSSSTVATVKITPATTTSTVTATPPSISSGGFVTLTATITTQSFGVPPTGTVTFFNGSAQIGNPVTVAGSFSNAAPGFAIATGSFTTSLSNIPAPISTWPRNLYFQDKLFWFLACLAVLWHLLMGVWRRRRDLLPAALALAFLLAGGIAACGGGGGGGGQQHTVTITAKYSGDSNYNGSTSAGFGVTVH